MFTEVHTSVFRFYNTKKRRSLITAGQRTAKTLAHISNGLLILSLIGLCLALAGDARHEPLAILSAKLCFITTILSLIYYGGRALKLDADIKGPHFSTFYIPRITELFIDKELKPLTTIYRHINGEFAFGYDLIDVEMSTRDTIVINHRQYEAVDMSDLANRKNTEHSNIQAHFDAHKLSRYDIIQRVNQVRQIKQTESEFKDMFTPVDLPIVAPDQSTFAKTLASTQNNLRRNIQALDKELDAIQNDLKALSKTQ